VNPLQQAQVVLGVSGGIAAYKAADLASKLVQAGAVVDTVLTKSATAFIAPLTFQALTKRPVHEDMFEPWTETSSGHVTLAGNADLVLVAPASANTIAHLALGLASDLLGVLALATTAPLLIAPAMEHHMFHHPATQGHLETLRTRGATIVGPATGHLASGAVGDGRLAPVEDILGAARQLLGRSGALAQRHVVITAGGTREPLDPVRYLGNGSSGAMGYALAQAALDRGAETTLISTVTNLLPPYGASVIPVQTALDMQDAVGTAVRDADALVMAAAVADFRPELAAGQKIKKRPGTNQQTVHLVQNPDILASVEQPGLLKIGFAAETESMVKHATAKLHAKGLAFIVANDAAATIGSARSQATIISRDEPPQALALLDKTELADLILERLINALESKP
jgi:phosphopantothenoylcysteine decarboxylase/phosphopantothenate--cysteine ligase